MSELDRNKTPNESFVSRKHRSREHESTQKIPNLTLLHSPSSLATTELSNLSVTVFKVAKNFLLSSSTARFNVFFISVADFESLVANSQSCRSFEFFSHVT